MSRRRLLHLPTQTKRASRAARPDIGISPYTRLFTLRSEEVGLEVIAYGSIEVTLCI